MAECPTCGHEHDAGQGAGEPFGSPAFCPQSNSRRHHPEGRFYFAEHEHASPKWAEITTFCAYCGRRGRLAFVTAEDEPDWGAF